MEKALKHKFGVGETVYFTASNVARPAASGTYEVIRLLPTDGDDCQYRIKNSTEAFERMAKGSQLEISCKMTRRAGRGGIRFNCRQRPPFADHLAECGEKGIHSADCICAALGDI